MSAIQQYGPGYPVIGSMEPEAITLGRYLDPRSPHNPLRGKMRYDGGLHVLVFGPNGSGKTRRLLIPNLLEIQNRSIVILDPKGELAATTAPFRRTLGEVVIINPFGVLTDKPGYEDLKSAGYNPLLALDPGAPSFNADVAYLAEALVKTEGRDPHWDDSARNLIASIIMFACMQARLTGKTPTLNDLRTLLCRELDIEIEDECRARGEKIEQPIDRSIGWISRLARLMAETGLPALQNKASQFVNWTNEIASIASSARRHTEWLDDAQIASDLENGTYDFRELRKRPVTVYLILPPDMIKRHAIWLRVILNGALRAVMRPLEENEPSTLFILEEFAALGHLESIEAAWALVRGYGIQIMPVLQDLTQLHRIYKEQWQTFTGMPGAIVSFGARDMTTAKWMSERAGDTTEVASSYSRNIDASGNSTEGLNWQQIKLPLLPPLSFFAQRMGSLFIWLQEMSDTVCAFAPDYEQITSARERARRNPYRSKKPSP